MIVITRMAMATGFHPFETAASSKKGDIADDNQITMKEFNKNAPQNLCNTGELAGERPEQLLWLFPFRT